MKRFPGVVVLIIVPLFFFGCATPKIRYHAEDDINENYIPFALLASRATITIPDQARDGGPGEKKAAALGVETPQTIKVQDLKKTKIIVTPTQAQNTLRYVEPQENILSKTNISITYFDTMKVPKTVGVVVEDNTIKLISALGAVGSTLGSIMVFMAPKSTDITSKDKEINLPIVLDFSNPEDFRIYGKQQCKPIGKPNEKYGYCFMLTEREGRKTTNDNKEMNIWTTFFEHYKKTFTRHVPFSRCVDVTVTINEWDEINKTAKAGDPLATYNTVIADSYHVDWLPLPQKGSITSQGICDANSTSEKSDNPGAFDLIEAVSKQVDSVWKAWHPKSK